MDTTSQQFTLIEYYHRKSDDSLKHTQKKYEEYAALLSNQCNQLRSDINVLYNYLNEAKVFVDNGKAACIQVTKEIKDTERAGIFPWCKRADSDSEDSDTDSACALD